MNLKAQLLIILAIALAVAFALGSGQQPQGGALQSYSPVPKLPAGTPMFIPIVSKNAPIP